MKVLASDKLSKNGLEIVEKAGFTIDMKTGLSEEELVKIIPNYDALLIRSGTTVTAKIIEAAKKLKIIGRAGVGVDNVDLSAATKKGIIVVNSPEGNTIAAAEHTVAMILSLSRNIPQAYVSLVKEHKWDRSKYKGVEVYGKTLGVIGLGKIGSHVAKCMQGMGMKVIAHDPFASKELAASKGIELMKLEDVLKTGDYLSFHIPKTEETKGLINKEKFEMMKKGVRIINCARGGIIVEDDLAEACKAGQVAAAAVDVFESEPTTESPMFDCENIVAVPHLGASTEEAQENVAIDVAEQVVEVLNGGNASAPVNIPTLKPELIGPVKDYIVLAEKIAKLAGGLCKDVINEISVEYSGDIAEKDVSPLTTVILKEVLAATDQGEAVNFVNAPLIAEEKKIKVKETKVEKVVDFAHLIEVKIKTKNEKRAVAGTLFEKIGERIVAIDGFSINIVPQGTFIVVGNEDKPGFIAGVSTLLGEAKINIASMIVGRSVAGGDAVTVISVDGDVSQDILKDIEKVKHVKGKAAVILF